jgi:hypothetical protein
VFTELVDTIAPDGVEICVQEEIYDDHYPDAGFGFITVQFDPGCQILNSERLLQYARTRRTQGSDFDRNRRQQETLKALQKEVLSAGGIANFVTSIPALYAQLADNYRTNLSLEQLLSLARLVNEIPPENVTFEAINNLDVDFATTVTGQEVLIPRQSQMRFRVQQAFNPLPDLTRADLLERATGEEATIVVYNNTAVSGLAGNTRDWLTSRGVTVGAVGNIEPPTNAPTAIRDYTGNPWTARYLADLLNLPESAIVPGTDGITSADVMVVVGEDIQQLLTGE